MAQHRTINRYHWTAAAATFAILLLGAITTFMALQIGQENGKNEAFAIADTQRLGAITEPASNPGFTFDFAERDKPQTANAWLSANEAVVLAGESVDVQNVKGFRPLGADAMIVVLLPPTKDGKYNATVTPGSTTPAYRWYKFKESPAVTTKLVEDIAKLAGWPCKTPTMCKWAQVVGIRDKEVVSDSMLYGAKYS